MDDTIKRLIENRARAFENYKEFLDAVPEGRDLSGEEQEKDARFRADLDALDERIDELTEVRERAEQFNESRDRWEAAVGRNVRDEKPNKDEDALRDFLTGKTRVLDIDMRSVESHINPDTGKVEFRDLSLTAAAGGNTVPTSMVRRLYEHMVEASGIRQTNATILRTAGGESLEIPKTTSFGTAAIVGEGTALAEADTAFGKTTMGAWKYGRLIQVSTELIQDTGVDLLGFIAREAGWSLGYASGAAFVTGSGTNAPLGVMIAAGTGVSGGTGVVGVPTAANLIDLFYSVASPYANRGQWFMNRSTEGKIRKITDSYGQYLWAPGLQIGAPNLLLGKPVVTDPNVAATGTSAVSVAFGDFSAYYIRDVANIRFERSDDYAFDKDLVTFRAVYRGDGDLIDLTGAIKTFAGGTA